MSSYTEFETVLKSNEGLINQMQGFLRRLMRRSKYSLCNIKTELGKDVKCEEKNKNLW